MQIVEYAYQHDFLQIGYFIAVAATIMKFYSEKFKGKPAYTLVLINDLLKLSFISLTVLVGFSVLIMVDRTNRAIENLQPPPTPEPIVVYDDRISQANEKFRQLYSEDHHLQALGALATDIYVEIFGNGTDRAVREVTFQPFGHSGIVVSCDFPTYGVDQVICSFGESG